MFVLLLIRHVHSTIPVLSAVFWLSPSAADAAPEGGVYVTLQLAPGWVLTVSVASFPRPIGLVRDAICGPPGDDCVVVVL